jgi:hypothetical protein
MPRQIAFDKIKALVNGANIVLVKKNIKEGHALIGDLFSILAEEKEGNIMRFGYCIHLTNCKKHLYIQLLDEIGE